MEKYFCDSSFFAVQSKNNLNTENKFMLAYSNPPSPPDKETYNKRSINNISLMTRDPGRPTSNNEQLRYSPDKYLWDYTQTFLSTHSLSYVTRFYIRRHRQQSRQCRFCDFLKQDKDACIKKSEWWVFYDFLKQRCMCLKNLCQIPVPVLQTRA